MGWTIAALIVGARLAPWTGAAVVAAVRSWQLKRTRGRRYVERRVKALIEDDKR